MHIDSLETLLSNFEEKKKNYELNKNDTTKLNQELDIFKKSIHYNKNQLRYIENDANSIVIDLIFAKYKFITNYFNIIHFDIFHDKNGIRFDEHYANVCSEYKKTKEEIIDKHGPDHYEKRINCYVWKEILKDENNKRYLLNFVKNFTKQ